MHSAVTSISDRRRHNFRSVKYFLDKFPCLNRSIEEVGVLRQLFAVYQITPFSKSLREEKRCDRQWARISEMMDADGSHPFEKLGVIMLTILTIFHSNADCERIFSSVRKVKTELRGKMSVATLSEILIQKTLTSGRNVDCYNYDPPADLLVRCKKATADYNQFLKDRKAAGIVLQDSEDSECETRSDEDPDESDA